MIKTNKNFLKTLVTSALLISSVVVSNHVESKVVEAAETTNSYTFTSKTWEDETNSWTSVKGGNSYANSGVQVTTGVSGASCKSNSSFTNVSKIVVNYCTNASKGAGSIAVTVGDSTVSQSVTTTGGTTSRALEYDLSSSYPSGNITLSVTCTTNSIYVIGISITTEAEVSTDFVANLYYNDGREDVPQISTSSDGLLTQPEEPKRTGYVFGGWYTESTYENPFDFSTKLTQDIDLYAKWINEVDLYLDSTKASLGFSYSKDCEDTYITSVDAIVDGEYAIVYDYNGTSLALNNGIDGSKYSVSELSSTSDTFTISCKSDYYTIQNADGKYLNVGSKTNVSLSDTETSWYFKEQSDGSMRLTMESVESPSRYLAYSNYNSADCVGNYASSNSSSESYAFAVKLVHMASYSFSNYAMRFGTTISAENYAKLGTVETYGVLMLPTAKLSADTEYSTFKEVYGALKDVDTFEEIFSTFNVLNVTNASAEGKIEMQGDAENGYSFGAVLRNVPVASLGTSISAVCYVINDAGDVYFAEQRDISISDMVDVYASGSVELDSNVLQVCKELQNYIASLSL